MTTVLGQGTYGCVLSPAFKCNPQDPESNKINKVTKVFLDNKEIDEEKHIMSKLNLSKIDPHEHYSIYKFFNCKYNPSMMTEVKTKCEGFKDANIKPVALNYRKASSTLEQVMKAFHWTDVNTSILLHELKNIINGIELFNRNGRFHMDLTDRNMMQEKKFEIVKHNPFKMIDFGLSQVGKKFVEEVNYSEYYASWPIEVYELSENEIDLRVYIDEYFQNSKRSFSQLYDEGIWDEDLIRKRVEIQKGKGLEVLYYVDPWSFIVILGELYMKMPDILEAKSKLKELLTLLSSTPMTAKDVRYYYINYLRGLSYRPKIGTSKKKSKSKSKSKSVAMMGGGKRRRTRKKRIRCNLRSYSI